LSEVALGFGRVFSHYEFKHPMNDRLMDEARREMLPSGRAPAPPGWLASFTLLGK
jgi:hypothetical protein